MGSKTSFCQTYLMCYMVKEVDAISYDTNGSSELNIPPCQAPFYFKKKKKI